MVLRQQADLLLHIPLSVPPFCQFCLGSIISSKPYTINTQFYAIMCPIYSLGWCHHHDQGDRKQCVGSEEQEDHRDTLAAGIPRTFPWSFSSFCTADMTTDVVFFFCRVTSVLGLCPCCCSKWTNHTLVMIIFIWCWYNVVSHSIPHKNCTLKCISLSLFNILVFPPCVILTTCYISLSHRSSDIIFSAIHLFNLCAAASGKCWCDHSCSIIHAIQSLVTYFLASYTGGEKVVEHRSALCAWKVVALDVLYQTVN